MGQLFYLGHPDEVDIDTRRRPYVHICGAAFNSNEQAATFSVDADQYTSAIRELQKQAKEAGQSTTSLRYIFFLDINSTGLNHWPGPICQLLAPFMTLRVTMVLKSPFHSTTAM